MKNVSLCFVINTVHRGKKILYRFPPNIFDETAFELSQEGATRKPYTPESLMDIFLSNTNIFSCIGQDFFDYSLSFIAELFSPRRTAYQNAVAFVVEDLKFIALPVFISADHRSRIISSSEHSSTNEQYEEKTEQVLLYSFNTVLVFDEKEENVRNLKELLQFFSKSLDFEERNHSFVGKQIYKAFEQNFEFQTSVKNLLKDYNKGEPLKDEVVKQIIKKIQDLSEEYRKKVELFNLLEELYKSIANLKPMKFKMDDCVLRTFNLYSKCVKMVDAPQINPFQTILIMKKKCCDQLGLDSSSRFKKFIDYHNPKKSFLEMSADLDLALEEITLYAAHLVNWQAGKIIHVISKESVYGINPELERGLLNEELFKKFSKRFKSELIVTLNTFSKPLPIAKVRDKLKMESQVLFKLITWFLKYNYLIEYNYYIYINCPKEVFNANINSMKNSSDEKKRKQGEILEKLSKFSYKKVSLNQIAFENDIPKEKLFKIVFQNKNLVDYYLAE